MTTPEPDNADSQQDSTETEAPTVSPAYSTPPPEGLPDAESK
jgi:hypothetical protein